MTLEDILREVERMPPKDRDHLLDRLEQLQAEELRHVQALEQFAALAGTAHSDFPDASRSHDQHLAQIAADKHEP